MYCPCCMQSFGVNDLFCTLCKVPLLAGLPSSVSYCTCSCKEEPVGEYIARKFGSEKSNADAMVFSLTHLVGEAFDKYTESLLVYND